MIVQENVCVCVVEGWEWGERKRHLADSSGRFQPSHILLLCVFTHGHKHTHSAPGLLHSFPVCSVRLDNAKIFHMLSSGKCDRATFYDFITATALIIAKAVMPL